MAPVAVGGFHHHIIGLENVLGIFENGFAGVANVPGKDDFPLLFLFGEPQLNAGRAQQVPGVHKTHIHPRGRSEPAAIGMGTEQLQHPFGVLHFIQRHIPFPAGAAGFPVAPFRFEHLNMGAVPQHDVAQLASGRGGVDLSPEALAVQKGQKSGVIDVGMGEDHHIHLAGSNGQADVHIGVLSLFHAIVDEHILPIHLQQTATAGDFMSSADKSQFHIVSPCLCSKSESVCIPFFYYTK